MRLLSIIVISSMSVFLSACSVLGSSDHQKDYVKNSREITPLVIPPSVPSIKQDSYYVIPPIANNEKPHAVSLKPPTL